jgi:hypothetical protein
MQNAKGVVEVDHGNRAGSQHGKAGLPHARDAIDPHALGRSGLDRAEG